MNLTVITILKVSNYEYFQIYNILILQNYLATLFQLYTENLCNKDFKLL